MPDKPSPTPAAPTPDELVIRHHQRFTCQISADIRISESDASRVRLSRIAAGAGGGVPGTVVDLSRGGLGLDCRFFIPRASNVRVGVSVPGFETIWVDGSIRRASMISREPRYYLGISFAEAAAPHVERLLAATGAAA